MKHRIDPKIDCVFKALLGAEENRNLLAHFLNAILASDLCAPITHVDILNPYSDKEFIDDKLSIVDVKARDANEHLYQIEIQLLSYKHLPERIVYTWADIYSQQLQSGNDYRLLKPTYAIWLLAENLVAGDGDYLHAYQLRDAKGRTLLDHGGIWLLELDKFSTQAVENEQQRWLQFFKAGEQLDDAELPDWMSTPEMRQAMTTLRQFSEKERNYHEYQARQNYLRQQRTIQWEMEQERQEKRQALLREQAAIQEKAAAMQKAEMAMQKANAAMQEKDAAMQKANAAMQEKDVAMQEKDAAMQETKDALAEIERLRALLAAK